jgi:hypothetical protein
MDIQTLYQKALKFAATKHTEAGQIVPGTNLPYVVYICNVAESERKVSIFSVHIKAYRLWYQGATFDYNIYLQVLLLLHL